MGTWDIGILDDDFARDVYDRYTDKERAGQPADAMGNMWRHLGERLPKHRRGVTI